MKKSDKEQQTSTKEQLKPTSGRFKICVSKTDPAYQKYVPLSEDDSFPAETSQAPDIPPPNPTTTAEAPPSKQTKDPQVPPPTSTKFSSSPPRDKAGTSKQSLCNDNMKNLEKRTICPTPRIDFNFLDEMGLLDEFTRLTERVGFRRKFWEIPDRHPTYKELTLEFLATLSIANLPEKRPGLSFCLKGEHFHLPLERVGRWLHFAPPQTDYLGYISKREAGILPRNAHPYSEQRALFWEQITGVKPEGDMRVGTIIHPILRTICRFMGCSIFSRGESTLRPRHEELQLLATMLRPDNELERPNLMLLMARYLVTLRSAGRGAGLLTFGSYVSLIADCLDVKIEEKRLEPGRLMGRESFRYWNWISYNSGGRPMKTTWGTERDGRFLMPINFPPLDFSNKSTWIMDGIAPQKGTLPKDKKKKKDGSDASTKKTTEWAPSEEDWKMMKEKLENFEQSQATMLAKLESFEQVQADTQADIKVKFKSVELSQEQEINRLDEIYEQQSRILTVVLDARDGTIGAGAVGAGDDSIQ